MKDVPNLSGGYFSNYDLTVKEFKDIREPFEETRIQDPLGPGPQRVAKDGRTWFYNSDNHYKGHVVAPWVTKMIAEHINASTLFRKAKLYDGRAPQEGFLLEGKIKRFEAFKERSMGAETAKYFGLVGASLTILGMRADYEAVTILTDVTLTDARNNKLLLRENFEGKVEGAEIADLHGWTVYHRADQSLKVAVNNLLQKLAMKNEKEILLPEPDGSTQGVKKEGLKEGANKYRGETSVSDEVSELEQARAIDKSFAQEKVKNT